MPELRVLNQNTFFASAEISEEFQTPSAVYFVYGDSKCSYSPSLLSELDYKPPVTMPILLQRRIRSTRYCRRVCPLRTSRRYVAPRKLCRHSMRGCDDIGLRLH
jgi:hypothetical protein